MCLALMQMSDVCAFCLDLHAPEMTQDDQLLGYWSAISLMHGRAAIFHCRSVITEALWHMMDKHAENRMCFDEQLLDVIMSS